MGMGRGLGFHSHLLRAYCVSAMSFHVNCGVLRKVSNRWRRCVVFSGNAAVSKYLALSDQSSSYPTEPSQPPQAAGPILFRVAEGKLGPREASTLPVTGAQCFSLWPASGDLQRSAVQSEGDLTQGSLRSGARPHFPWGLSGVEPILADSTAVWAGGYGAVLSGLAPLAEAESPGLHKQLQDTKPLTRLIQGRSHGPRAIPHPQTAGQAL